MSHVELALLMVYCLGVIGVFLAFRGELYSWWHPYVIAALWPVVALVLLVVVAYYRLIGSPQ